MFAGSSPSSSMAWASVAAKWLSPPPLAGSPAPVKRRMMPGAACTQPARSPGASILENEPSDATQPSAELSSVASGGGGGGP